MGQSNLAFIQGGGEMGARMRAMDWSRLALGPIDAWPQSLRSTVSMMLPSKAQIILFWGPDFSVLYNDAYRPVFGAKHPDALGLPGREAWHEIWDSVLHELLAGVVRTGEAFWGKDLLFELERHGFPEETYFDVSTIPFGSSLARLAVSTASSPKPPSASSAGAACRCCAVSPSRMRPRAPPARPAFLPRTP